MESFKNYTFILKNEIKLAFSNNKYFLLAAILIFVIPLIIGYIYADQIANYIQPMVDAFEQQVEDGTVTLTTTSLFSNNVMVAIILYALSALGAVLGAVVLANNGLFIGFYGSGYNLFVYLLLTLPHGIFEIPAIIIATTGGFTLLSFAVHFVYNLIYPDYSYTDIFDPYFSDVKLSFKERISASLSKNQNKIKESFILLCISVVFLIIAAFIEANITLPLAQLILSLFGIGFA